METLNLKKLVVFGFFLGSFLGSMFAFQTTFASGTVTGLGTDHLSVDVNSDYDKLFIIQGINNYTPDSPRFAPTTFDMYGTNTWYTGATVENPLRLAHTNQTCFGNGDSYDVCVASGVAVGSTAGYYIVDNVWYEVGGATPPEPVFGCMDSNANNYNSSATESDGSCTYGCTDPSFDDPMSPEIFNTLYLILICVASGVTVGVFALLFYASLAILRGRSK